MFLAAEPGAVCWAVWVLSCGMKRSLLSEARLWQSFALDDGGFLISSLPFSLTAPEPLFIYFAPRTLEESEHLTLLLCALVCRTPPECTSGASAEIFVSLTDVPYSPADEHWASGQLTPA